MGGIASIFKGPPDPPKAPKPAPPPPKVSDADASGREARRENQNKKGFEATLLSQGLGKGGFGGPAPDDAPTAPSSQPPSGAKPSGSNDGLLGGERKRRRSNLLGRSGGDVGTPGGGPGGV